MTCGYVDDGMNLKGYIKESPGLYPALRFVYRPMPNDERVRLFDNWRNVASDEQLARACEKLSQKIISWDMKDRQGRALNCREPGVFRKLVWPLHERLMDIITAISAPDTDPEAQSEASPASDGSHFAETGVPNSPAG